MATKTASKSSGGKKSWKSRAALRTVEPGSQVECVHCGERVKFQARMRHMQMICNVYEKGVWQRVEHFHSDCYDTADRPYGDPED